MFASWVLFRARMVIVSEGASKQQVIITGVGAALEWFDYSLYIYLSPFLSRVFFAHASPLMSLLQTYAVFSIASLSRPIGGVLFGQLGDRWGRVKVLQLTTGLIALPMFVVCFLPTPNYWGWVSLAIFILMRFFEGMIIGGAYIAVMVLLCEQAPLRYRGFVSSFAPAFASIGFLLSSFLVAMLLHYLGNDTMIQWGWRIGYGVGGLFSLGLFFLQLKLKESPIFQSLVNNNEILDNPIKVSLEKNKQQLFCIFLLCGFIFASYCLCASYMVTFLTNIVKIDNSLVLKVSILSLAFYILVMPVAGYLSDIIGRRKIIIIPTLILALGSHYFFSLLFSGHEILIYLSMSIIMICISFQYAVLPIFISELLPDNQRVSGFSLSYNLGVAVMSGGAPLIATLIISKYHVFYSLSWMLMLLSVGVIILASLLPETCPNRVSIAVN